ncbi:MAG TPA: MerR family transcriptional regulator [Thermoanaerobaculia bacterium]|jgi:DNA-binding transcriptional MerR regulator|nr:MerR family transcriptional regulator [Thermoanaerobaculia bacterium]
MLIGKLAKTAGVNVQTLRYYERIGLLCPDRRSASGYRHYDERALARLERIKQAQRLGFRLAEVRTILAADDGSMVRVLRSAAEKKARELQARIDELRAAQRTLLVELERCRCDQGSPCAFTGRTGHEGEVAAVPAPLWRQNRAEAVSRSVRAGSR